MNRIIIIAILALLPCVSHANLAAGAFVRAGEALGKANKCEKKIEELEKRIIKLEEDKNNA